MGVDVSAKSLEMARKGVYRPWSFRGVDATSLARWVDPVAEGGWRVKPTLQKGLHLVHANLLALPSEVDALGPFDFIFCRNVMIYFSRWAGREVMRRLMGLLSEDGYLFVGPADHDACEGHPVEAHGDVFVYRKGRSALAAPSPDPLADATYGVGPVSPEEHSDPAAVAPEPAASPYDSLLGVAREQRDRGRDEAALRAFDEAIAAAPSRPEAYFEQALLLERRGMHAAAREFLSRALLLDVCFVPAAVLLARVLLHLGQHSRARQELEQIRAHVREQAPDAGVPGWPEMNYGSLERVLHVLIDRAPGGAA